MLKKIAHLIIIDDESDPLLPLWAWQINGVESYPINEFTVDEQNLLVKGFYEHVAFKSAKGQSTMNKEIIILYYM